MLEGGEQVWRDVHVGAAWQSARAEVKQKGSGGPCPEGHRSPGCYLCHATGTPQCLVRSSSGGRGGIREELEGDEASESALFSEPTTGAPEGVADVAP